MKEITLNFYTDPGHGWLAVKRKLLLEFVDANQISPYSYQRGQTVYLEEDCDAPRFLQKVKGHYSVKFNEKHTDKRHPIRSYNPYKGV